jgi:hypothetical protein
LRTCLLCASPTFAPVKLGRYDAEDVFPVRTIAQDLRELSLGVLAGQEEVQNLAGNVTLTLG